MQTVDLFKEHKTEYTTPKKPVLVNVGQGHYLAVSGQGEPGGPEFQEAVGALYAMAWTLKMTRKFGGEPDFKVGALEGVYHDRCDWQLLIRVPSFVTKAEIKKAAETLVKKGKPDAVRRVELIRLKEGQCTQVLQVGPYETVMQTVETLKTWAAEQGLQCNGPLHEVYLNDPRRVAPEKIKTIVRHPVKKA